MKWIIIFLIIILSFTIWKLCSNSRLERISFNEPFECKEILKKAVIDNGDIDAYKSLYYVYLDYSISEEFLLYAMIMANKYDYPQAYFDVFNNLTKVYWNDLTRMDNKSAKIAMEYLIIAAEKGHHQAQEMVENININLDDNSKEQILKIYNIKFDREVLEEK